MTKYWSRQSFGEVVRITPTNVTVRNESGLEWDIGRGIFDAEFVVADEHKEELEVTRTQLIEVLLKHPRIAVSVNFNKKLVEKDFVSEVTALAKKYALGEVTEKEFKKTVAAGMCGEERTLIGRHLSDFDEHGRLRFFDMEAKAMLKLIDTRTINWAIIAGTKYTVKGAS